MAEQVKREQVMALWKKKSKGGKTYLDGKDAVGYVRGFYNTKKKNPKEPDVRIYGVGAEGKLSEEPILSLWCNVGKSGKKYLSGRLNGKFVVGFIGEAKEGSKSPDVVVYYQDVFTKQEEKKAEVKKEAKKEAVEEALPF